MFSNDSADVNDNYYLCVKGFNRQKEVAFDLGTNRKPNENPSRMMNTQSRWTSFIDIYARV